jgi:hypothetical protein
LPGWAVGLDGPAEPAGDVDESRSEAALRVAMRGALSLRFGVRAEGPVGVRADGGQPPAGFSAAAQLHLRPAQFKVRIIGHDCAP